MCRWKHGKDCRCIECMAVVISGTNGLNSLAAWNACAAFRRLNVMNGNSKRPNGVVMAVFGMFFWVTGIWCDRVSRTSWHHPKPVRSPGCVAPGTGLDTSMHFRLGKSHKGVAGNVNFVSSISYQLQQWRWCTGWGSSYCGRCEHSVLYYMDVKTLFTLTAILRNGLLWRLHCVQERLPIWS